MGRADMKSLSANSNKDRKPIILTTDPDEVMWASLICAAVASIVLFLFTYTA